MRFVDLFAGLGGFHQALAQLGHECVFACEIDPDLRSLYWKNFGVRSHGDIRQSHKAVPAHEVLCAGFPCQPFSKAGEQRGFSCPDSGDLFKYVMCIVKAHRPLFILLENVPNLLKHDKGKTWESIQQQLEACGYAVKKANLSPHSFGVPQIRQRTIIVAGLHGLQEFSFPSPTHVEKDMRIEEVLDHNPSDAKPIPIKYIEYLETWQRLIDKFPQNEELPSFPIWAMEFGATYPLHTTPASMSVEELGRFKGMFGTSLQSTSRAATYEKLPKYALDPNPCFPQWKVKFIRQNRDFYHKYQSIIDPWLPSIKVFPASFQKLEWNWKGGPRNVWKTIIQFRSSGIRIKRANSTPSLVALTTSQVPIIAWERRYMTFRECARLQSMGNLPNLPDSYTGAYRALGNAVNVTVITNVAASLLSVKPPRVEGDCQREC